MLTSRLTAPVALGSTIPPPALGFFVVFGGFTVAGGGACVVGAEVDVGAAVVGAAVVGAAVVGATVVTGAAVVAGAAVVVGASVGGITTGGIVWAEAGNVIATEANEAAATTHAPKRVRVRRREDVERDEMTSRSGFPSRNAVREAREEVGVRTRSSYAHRRIVLVT